MACTVLHVNTKYIFAFIMPKVISVIFKKTKLSKLTEIHNKCVKHKIGQSIGIFVICNELQYFKKIQC